MKKADFTKEGGFPMRQDTLEFMQDSYAELNDALVRWLIPASPYINDPLGSNSHYILSGLGTNISGTLVLSGWVIINERLLYFAGADYQAIATNGIGVYTEIVEVQFHQGGFKSVYKTQTAKVGGDDAKPLSGFKRIPNPKEIQDQIPNVVVENKELPVLGFQGQLDVKSVDIYIPQAEIGDVVNIGLRQAENETAQPDLDMAKFHIEQVGCYENGTVKVKIRYLADSALLLNGRKILAKVSLIK